MAFYKEVVKTTTSLTCASGNTANDSVDQLKIVGTANTAAADVVTLTNAAFGQASTLTIPDPGVAAANFVLAPATNSYVLTATATMTTANMTVYTTPLLIVPAPGSGLCVLVTGAYVATHKGSSAFATGTAPIIQYGSTVHGGGTIATASGLAAGDITATTDQVRNLFPIATGAQTGLSNKGIYFSCATGDYTNGTGSTVVITVSYVIVASAN